MLKKDKLNVHFIGGFFPKDKISEYVENSLGEVHYAANALQQSIISGLSMFEDIEMKLITAPFLINYPHYKRLFIKAEKNESYQIVPFLNVKLLDSFSKARALKRMIKKEIPNHREDDILLIYGMFDYFLKGIPKNYNNKVCLIIPDLPRMMGGDLSKLKIRLYINYIERVIQKNLHKVDCFVFISAYMRDYVDVRGKPWIVVEGIYNNSQKVEDQPKEGHSTILYTGTLDKRYGILDLLDAFSQIPDQDYRLWICGEGAGKKEVLAASAQDRRIQYYGQIAHEEAQVLQRKATILINPRKGDMEYTKFSFPSKTMEYLASGTPTIMYPLAGIPVAYHPYFFSPKDDTIMALKEKIIEVATLSEADRVLFGQKARHFILKNKNPKVQVGKIVKMIRELGPSKQT